MGRERRQRTASEHLPAAEIPRDQLDPIPRPDDRFGDVDRLEVERAQYSRRATGEPASSTMVPVWSPITHQCPVPYRSSRRRKATSAPLRRR